MNKGFTVNKRFMETICIYDKKKNLYILEERDCEVYYEIAVPLERRIFLPKTAGTDLSTIIMIYQKQINTKAIL